MYKIPEGHQLIAQSSQPEFKGDADIHAPLYIPARWAIAAALDSTNSIILPDHPAVRAHVAFLEATLKVRGALTVIWSPHKSYLLDTDIAEHLLPTVRDLVQTKFHHDGSHTMVLPYKANQECLAWAEQLPYTTVMGDTLPFTAAYGHKGILHRHVKTQTVPAQLEHPAIQVVRGYTCDDKDDLLAAFQLLQRQGVTQMIIKPVLGSTGEGIKKITTAAEIDAYQWQQGGGFVLEECVAIDQHDVYGEVNCSVQFIGDGLAAEPTTQLVDGVHWVGNISPTISAADLSFDVMKQTTAALALLKSFGHKGPGGFDFVSVGGNAHLIDPNLGRFTGAHLPHLVAGYLAPKAAWACVDMPVEKPVAAVWELLQSKGLAFDATTKRGVYPLCHLEGMWSKHIAFAHTGKEALWMIQRAKEVLS